MVSNVARLSISWYSCDELRPVVPVPVPIPVSIVVVVAKLAFDRLDPSPLVGVADTDALTGVPSSVSVGFVDGALTSLEAATSLPLFPDPGPDPGPDVEGPATGGGPDASWLYGTEATRPGEDWLWVEDDAEVLFFLPKMEAMSMHELSLSL